MSARLLEQKIAESAQRLLGAEAAAIEPRAAVQAAEAVIKKEERYTRALRGIQSRVAQPHSYLRSNNERLGISEEQEYQAGSFNPKHAEVGFDYMRPFVRAGEPLAVAYDSLMSIAHEAPLHDPMISTFIYQATEGCEHVFRQMTRRTLDKKSYDYAVSVVNDTTRIVKNWNLAPRKSADWPSIKDYLIGRNLLASFSSDQE